MMDMGQEQTKPGSESAAKSLRRVDQVCELAAEGLTDKQIAEALSISRHTVVNYWRRLREYYNVSTRTSLVTRHLKERNQAETDALQVRLKDLTQQNGKLISENAKIQRQLDRAQRLLEHTEEIYHSVAAFTYRTEIDPPYRCLEMSTSAEKVGINVNEFLADGCSWIDVVLEEDVQNLLEIVGTSDVPYGERVYYVYRIKGEEPIWILDIQVATPGRGNDEPYFAGIAINATVLVKSGLLKGRVARLRHSPFLTEAICQAEHVN